MITDFQGQTDYELPKGVTLLPVFFIGLMLADSENIKPKRPLDYIRELNIYWKILLNSFLFALFVLYGSFYGDGSCLLKDEGDCEYHRILSINHVIPKLGCTYIGAISLIILSLTSQWFQWLLASSVFQFFGRISFSLYLFHELFTEWVLVDSYFYFMSKGLSQNESVVTVFFIFTPILIFLSWVLTICVDAPAKDFAYELDI